MSDGFKLGDLDPFLFGKLEGKSYFRLQLTCKNIHLIIREDHNASVHVTDSGYFEATYDHYYRRTALLEKRLDGRSRPYEEIIIEQSFGGASNWVHPHVLFGTRLPKLKLSNECNFNHIHSTLNKYRLTFEVVEIENSEWSKEETLTLLQLVKPRRIFLYSVGSNRYEALLGIKTLETVIVKLMPKAVAEAAPKLLTKFGEVKIIAVCNHVKYVLLRIMMGILCSQPFPNLYKFNFSTSEEFGVVDGPVVPEDYDQLIDELVEYNIMRRDSTYDEISAIVDVPNHFPPGSICELSLRFREAEIYCGVGDTGDWSCMKPMQSMIGVVHEL